MLTRSFFSILIVAASIVLMNAQTPDAKPAADKPTRPTIRSQAPGSVDLPFAQGIDLMFLIKELAREMDLNVMFDSESFRTAGRKTNIDLKNVTAANALNYVLLQERLISEEVGTKTIIVAHEAQVRPSIPYSGLRLSPLTKQLADYFGVKSGLLISEVREDSSGFKAGLKAGDVITMIDDEIVMALPSRVRTPKHENKSEMTLKIVRDKQEMTIGLMLDNGIK